MTLFGKRASLNLGIDYSLRLKENGEKTPGMI
jgi:hypothetical protein